MSSKGADQRPSHHLVEHTGEVQLQLEAPDLASLFEEAGRALASLMMEESAGSMGTAIAITVEATDRADLLFEWLNELIYRSEMDKVVFVEFSVQEISAKKLRAEVRGVTPREIRTAVKAATFHDLTVADIANGVSATVVLDV